MNELTGGKSGFIDLFHNGGGNLSIPVPFEKDIFLFDTVIAGTTYVKNIGEIVKTLGNGDNLDFFREPDNKYDHEAIVIKTKKGEKLGYVPKADNVVFARLMDAGKLLFGKIDNIEEKGKWIKISIKVYLHE